MNENTNPVKKQNSQATKRPAGYARSSEESPALRAKASVPPAMPGNRTAANRPHAAKGAKKPLTAAQKKAAAKRRARKKRNNIIFAVLAVLLVLALGVGGWYLLKEKDDNTDRNNGKTASASPTPVTDTADPNGSNTERSFAFEGIEGEDNTLPMSGARSIKVDDLSVTPGLDPDWLNVLLLGTDARTLSEPARTDTMIICSINTKTGEVKLTSIMRDTNVFFEGHTKTGTRINNAFFYGGPELAMKVVNETFGMNIEKYVCVNFDGFAVIAEKIGGVDLVISESERQHINKNVMEQYHILIDQGKIDYDVAEQEYFDTLLREHTTDGNKIHLNGMQALGYARIRKIDSDYGRTDRQRRVLNALMEELKDCPNSQLVSMALASAGYFSTNMSLTGEILQIASSVLYRENFELADSMHLPVAGTYFEGVRNEDARLWDVDVQKNTQALHDFIYND